MKEAFWGVLIVLLGLFGIVVVNIFQNVTVDNDRVYYLIRESTEASAFDAIDLTYYRLSGNLRIVEDKFVENLTRRFGENITVGDYTIVVEDINEMPPKVSLRIRSGIKSLGGDEFGIQNRVDGILETKYSLEEVLEFLDITPTEWEELTKKAKIEVDEGTGENTCKTGDINDDELECIPGDIQFIEFGDADLPNGICTAEVNNLTDKSRTVKYKVCNCGKWEEKTETVTAKPVKVNNDVVYTWVFTKVGEIRTITESIKENVRIKACITGIQAMVPKDIEKVNQNSTNANGDKIKLPYTPSITNYVVCPPEGIRIPVGMKFTMYPKYAPTDASERYLDWVAEDEEILGVSYKKINETNPTERKKLIDNHSINKCILNKEGTNCLLESTITAKKVGTTSVKVTTQRGHTATCKIEVFDGNVSSVSCKDKTLEYNDSGVMESSYSPINALNTKFTWSISDSNIATINENTGAVQAKNSGKATITVTAPGGKTGTCTLNVNAKPEEEPKEDPEPDGGEIITESGGGCSVTLEDIISVVPPSSQITEKHEYICKIWTEKVQCGTQAKYCPVYETRNNTCTTKSCCGQTCTPKSCTSWWCGCAKYKGLKCEQYKRCTNALICGQTCTTNTCTKRCCGTTKVKIGSKSCGTEPKYCDKQRVEYCTGTQTWNVCPNGSKVQGSCYEKGSNTYGGNILITTSKSGCKNSTRTVTVKSVCRVYRTGSMTCPGCLYEKVLSSSSYSESC